MKVLHREGRQSSRQTTNVIDYQQRSAADNERAAGARSRDRGRDRPHAPSATPPAAWAEPATRARRLVRDRAAPARRAPERAARERRRRRRRTRRRAVRSERSGHSVPRARAPGAARGPSDIEQIGKQGGFTALHYAVRDGYADAADALLDAGADVNRRSDGDLSTPLRRRGHQRPVRHRDDAARARRRSESAERRRRGAAVRGAQQRVGAAHVVSAADRGRAAEGVVSRRCSRRCSRPAPIRTRARSRTSGTRRTTPAAWAWTSRARRRSGAPPTRSTSTRCACSSSTAPIRRSRR